MSNAHSRIPCAVIQFDHVFHYARGRIDYQTFTTGMDTQQIVGFRLTDGRDGSQISHRNRDPIPNHRPDLCALHGGWVYGIQNGCLVLKRRGIQPAACPCYGGNVGTVGFLLLIVTG